MGRWPQLARGSQGWPEVRELTCLPRTSWFQRSPGPHLKPTLLLKKKAKTSPCLGDCGFRKLLGYQYIYPQPQTFGSRTAHSSLTWGKIMRIQSMWVPEGPLKSARELIIARRYHSCSLSPGFAIISFFLLLLSWFALTSSGVSNSVVICTCFFFWTFRNLGGRERSHIFPLHRPRASNTGLLWA